MCGVVYMYVCSKCGVVFLFFCVYFFFGFFLFLSSLGSGAGASVPVTEAASLDFTAKASVSKASSLGAIVKAASVQAAEAAFLDDMKRDLDSLSDYFCTSTLNFFGMKVLLQTISKYSKKKQNKLLKKK